MTRPILSTSLRVKSLLSSSGSHSLSLAHLLEVLQWALFVDIFLDMGQHVGALERVVDTQVGVRFLSVLASDDGLS